ncbi:TY5A [Symbiodinium necroappetens]|uniref:TY5A protein n=1 Tax=Symbiodinium necroappetens TaxID=1628268 RepID=A0A813BRP7_9DINO|nr:TY5A [Symbiodinium necroappetens]
MASIHVDDTRYAGDETSAVIWEQLHKRLKFGSVRKATEGWQKFCGRWERQDPTTLEMEISMQGYIDGVPTVKQRVVHGDQSLTPLTDGEKKLISSVVGQLNWAARQGRFDLCFGASLIQQLAGQGRAEALKWVNTVVRRAREPLQLKVPCLGCPLSEMVILAVSDAAYGAMPNGSSQGGTMVMVANPNVLEGEAPVCILEAISSKIQRVVRCSMSAEVSSLATAFEHGDYVRAVFVELVHPRFELKRWKVCVAPWQHILVTDARTGYDAVNSETLPTDRKIAIDVGVLRQGLVEEGNGCKVRWVPGSQMPGDGLTKWHHNGVLTTVMSSGLWSLRDTAEAQELRKVAAAKRAAWRRSAKATDS